MRRYDDPVEVHQGMVQGCQGPQWFRWRHLVWWVRAVVGHWLETGAWWAAPAARAVSGESPGGEPADLLAERECWRVQARPADRDAACGVFDLVLDWGTGGWRLAGCLD